MQFIRQIDPITKGIVLINLFSYAYNLYKNGFDAITGISAKQMLTVGGVTGDNSLLHIITAMFSHYSFMHLLLNMGTLILLSSIVRGSFSSIAYLSTYLGSGIISNLFTKWIDPNMVSLGASGSIYGLFGMLFIGSIFSKQFPYLKHLTTIIFITLGVNVFYTLSTEKINSLVHFTGLGVGMLATIIVISFLKKRI